MHTLYFTKVDKAENSEDARRITQNVLDANGFAGESGFFSSSKADWYSIGGRWSGLFTDKSKVEELIKPLLEKELEERPDLLDYLSINPHLMKSTEKLKEIDALAIEKTGLPYFRDTYGNGHEDDAIKITAEILKTLKEKYDECEVCEIVDECIEEEYGVTKLDESNIGEWLVIIDYHN